MLFYPIKVVGNSKLYNLGWCYNELGDYSRAQSSLKRALDLNAQDSKSEIEIAYSYRKLGEKEPKASPRATEDFAEAVNAYKSAIQLDSQSVSAYTGLGDVLYLAVKQYPEAVKAYTAAVRMSGANPAPRVLYNLGWLNNDLKHYAEAIQFLKQATQLKPEDVDAFFELGFAQKQQENYPAAIGSFSEAVRLKPDYGNALYQLGWIYNEQKRYTEALPVLRRAARLMPSDAKTSSELGYTFLQLKNYDEAIVSYRSAIRLQPDNASAHH